MGVNADGRFWTRPVFEVDAPFVEQPATVNPWLPTNHTELIVTADSNSILIHNRASGELIERLQVAAYESGFNFSPILSPDEQSLAIFVHEPSYGLGKALFVVSTPSQ